MGLVWFRNSEIQKNVYLGIKLREKPKLSSAKSSTNFSIFLKTLTFFSCNQLHVQPYDLENYKLFSRTAIFCNIQPGMLFLLNLLTVNSKNANQFCPAIAQFHQLWKNDRLLVLMLNSESAIRYLTCNSYAITHFCCIGNLWLLDKYLLALIFEPRWYSRVLCSGVPGGIYGEWFWWDPLGVQELWYVWKA